MVPQVTGLTPASLVSCGIGCKLAGLMWPQPGRLVPTPHGFSSCTDCSRVEGEKVGTHRPLRTSGKFCWLKQGTRPARFNRVAKFRTNGDAAGEELWSFLQTNSYSYGEQLIKKVRKKSLG